MTTIKGPITFSKGDLPDKLKQEIKKSGLSLPFDVTQLKDYSNENIDSWFRGKKDGKKVKFNRATKDWKEDKN